MTVATTVATVGSPTVATVGNPPIGAFDVTEKVINGGVITRLIHMTVATTVATVSSPPIGAFDVTEKVINGGAEDGVTY